MAPIDSQPTRYTFVACCASAAKAKPTNARSRTRQSANDVFRSTFPSRADLQNRGDGTPLTYQDQDRSARSSCQLPGTVLASTTRVRASSGVLSRDSMSAGSEADLAMPVIGQKQWDGPLLT